MRKILITLSMIILTTTAVFADVPAIDPNESKPPTIAIAGIILLCALVITAIVLKMKKHKKEDEIKNEEKE